jgi:hypothetical protein
LFCPGCASWEYDVVQPPVAQAHITADHVTRVRVEPFEVGLQAVEGRLVMWLYNNSNESIEILGGKSTVVDADGQTHPLPGQTIAAGASVKMILPPVQPPGPQPPPIITVGVSSGGLDNPGYIRPNGYGTSEPRAADEKPSAYYWDWEGQSSIHLTLVYQRGTSTNQLMFVIQRVKK